VPPNVNAGADQAITLPTDTVSLDGTVDDPEDTPSITWSCISGPASVSFTDANAVDTSAVFTDAGTYVLRLSADDGTNSPVNDSLTVTINPDPANDEDIDGLPDDWELLYFADVLDCDPGVDTDGDDLTNVEEYNAGTNPIIGDSDGDGIPDGDDPYPLTAVAAAAGTQGGCSPSSSSSFLVLIFALVLGMTKIRAGKVEGSEGVE
ncbi:hypothetical protein ACFL4W_04745, partial [Planctomycetota bacterium]